VSSGRSYAGEAAEARVARRRRQLLDAGLELFGTIGYQRTTVRGLCRAAKVADRYFYEEFDGTEDLLLAVYNDCLDRLERSVTGALLAVPSEVEAMAEAGLDAFLAEVESDPRLARIVWFEVLGVSPRVEAAYMERTARFGELLVRLLDERGLLASLPSGERRVLTLALVGGVSQVVLDWVSRGFVPARSHLVKPLTRMLLASATITER
jgi:AcrR family transcriptional regulator